VRTSKYNTLMIYDFNNEKNKLLFKKRGVTFQHVIDSISEKGILLDFQHPNTEKYPKQRDQFVYSFLSLSSHIY